MKRNVLLRLALAWVVAACLGCGGAAGRVEVTGLVHFPPGQPLKKGSIQFEPLGDEESFSGAVIQDGEFRIAKKDGLVPGKYRVRIYAAQDAGLPPGEGEPPKDSSGRKMTVEPIPPEWNEASQQEIEITAAGPNRFTFDVNKSPPGGQR